MRDLQDDLERAALQADRTATPTVRRRRRRVAALAAVGTLGLGGVAVAATAIWKPSGPELGGRTITVDAFAPPESQLQTFGVLRRPATALDRDAVSLFALRVAPINAIRTNYVRRVATDNGARGFVLVPIGAEPTPGAAASNEGRTAEPDDICVTLTNDNGAGGSCLSTAEIRRGEAILGDSDHVYGVVPDGVAEVTVRSGDQTARAPVDDNAFVAQVNGMRRPNVTWLAPDGSVVAQR